MTRSLRMCSVGRMVVVLPAVSLVAGCVKKEGTPFETAYVFEWWCALAVFAGALAAGFLGRLIGVGNAIGGCCVGLAIFLPLVFGFNLYFDKITINRQGLAVRQWNWLWPRNSEFSFRDLEVLATGQDLYRRTRSGTYYSKKYIFWRTRAGAEGRIEVPFPTVELLEEAGPEIDARFRESRK